MAAMTAAIVGGTALSMFSSMNSAATQASALKAQGEYQQQMYELNSKLAGIQAEDAEQRGEVNANASESKAAKFQSAQRAEFAGQGVDVSYGSARDVQLETLGIGHHDAMTIRNNAWREAFGFKADAAQNMSKGTFASMAANNAANNTMVTGGLQAVATGLKGYADYNRPAA